MSNPSSSRPLSPHLQVYKFLFGMVLSISHRITGLWLSLATAVLVLMLSAIAQGPLYYELFSYWLEQSWGRFFFLFSLFCFFYHLCNGIRHLFWDAGKGLELKQAKWSGIAVLVATLVATGVVWCVLPAWWSAP